MSQKTTNRIIVPILLSLFGLTPASAGNGLYMGQWTPAELDCSPKSLPQRLVINPLVLQSGAISCKFLGMSENTDARMTFKALCNDTSLKWQDEISLSATEQVLILKLKTENIEHHYQRCGPMAPSKSEASSPAPKKKKNH